MGLRGRVLLTLVLGLVVALLVVLAGRAVPEDDPPTARMGPSAQRPSDCGSTLPKVTGDSWQCTFVEDFDGSGLDPAAWAVQDTTRTGFTVGRTCLSGGPHVRVDRGALHLTVTQEQPFTCRSPQGGFTTRHRGGGISTWRRFAQAYGRFEARISYPRSAGAGLHGNFWLNPAGRVYGAWPHSGEIDVAEWFSARPGRAFPSLHYAGRTRADTGWGCLVGDASAFHTYAVEWSPTTMRFLYDGRLCYQRSWTPNAPLAAPQPFDRPFHLALTHAAGGAWNAPTAGTRLPATMVVDWVRAWQ